MLKNKQRLLVKSFYLRIFSVRNSLDQDFSLKHRSISSGQKFYIAFYLRCRRNFHLYYHFYFVKNNNISFSFNFFLIYKSCFNFLLKIILFPFIQTKIENCLFNYSLQGYEHDIFLDLKFILLKNLKKLYYFKWSIFNVLNSINKIWLLKNFPLDVSFLENFMKLGNHTFNESICLLIFSYIFKGLV